MKEEILVLRRVKGEGDTWTDVDDETIKLNSLTEALNHVYLKTKITEFHIFARKGDVYTISGELEPEVAKYDIYDES